MKLIRNHNKYRMDIKEVILSDTYTIDMLKRELHKAAEELDYMLLGLSACQIGLGWNAAIVNFNRGYKKEDMQICFNLKEHLAYGKQVSVEGCLCNPKKRIKVYRHRIGLVSFYDENMKKKYRVLTYKKLRIFEHELDHQNGVLIYDKEIK